MLLTPEPGSLSQNTKVGNAAFSFWGVLPKFVWLYVTALLLKGFLGTVAVSGAGITALKACELMSKHMVAFLRAIAVSCFREISSNEQIFFVLVSKV